MTINEKKLEESEVRFKTLFKGSPIPTYAWQKTGNSFKLIDFNKAAETITQGKVGKFLGITAIEMYKDRPDILNDLSRCFNEKINLRKEMKYIFSASEEEKDLLVTYSYIPPNSVLVHTEDITDRKVFERKLKESEEKYRNLFNNAPFAIILFNLEGTFLDCNDATNLISGYSKEELIGKNFRDFNFYINIKSANLDERQDRVKVGKTPKTRDILLKKKNGTQFWARTNIEFINIKENIYIQAIIQDISEQKESQKKLEESESKFRTIFEAIPDLYILLSGDGTILEYRGKETNLYPNSEEFMGKKVIDLLPLNLGKSFLKLIKKTLKTKQPQVFEYGLQINGEECFFESRFFYVYKDKVFNFIRDITQRKNFEKKISDMVKFPSEDPNPVLRTSEEKVIYINKSGQDLFDLTEDNKIPDPLRDIIINTLKQNVPHILEVEFGDKTYSFDLTPISQEGYVNIYGRNITERKKTEIALNLEKKFVDDILNSSMDTIFVFNPANGRAVRWNNRFRQISGYSDEEIASIKAPDSYYNEEDLKRASEAIKNVLEKGTNKVEISLITKDGKSIPYEYTVTIVKDPSGDTLIVSVGRDISERKITEDKIKESEQKFRDLYEEAPIAYFSIGPDESILRVNNAAKRLLGYESF
ncbi:MAG: PAS domain-containing protein [Candidatus Thorarchaeota archaeon]